MFFSIASQEKNTPTKSSIDIGSRRILCQVTFSCLQEKENYFSLYTRERKLLLVVYKRKKITFHCKQEKENYFPLYTGERKLLLIV